MNAVSALQKTMVSNAAAGCSECDSCHVPLMRIQEVIHSSCENIVYGPQEFAINGVKHVMTDGEWSSFVDRLKVRFLHSCDHLHIGKLSKAILITDNTCTGLERKQN